MPELNNLLPAIAPFILVVATTVLALGIGFISARRRQAAWTEFAARTGLKFKPGRFAFIAGQVQGTYNGYAVRLYTYSSGGSRNRTTYTRLALGVPFLEDAVLTLSRESWMNDLFRKFGANDIQLGDPLFDDHFYIKAQPEELAARVYTPDLRGRLIRGLQGRLALMNGELSITRTGVDMDTARLQTHLDLLADLAEAAGAEEAGAEHLHDETQWGNDWDKNWTSDAAPERLYPPPSRAAGNRTVVVILIAAGALLALICGASALAFMVTSLS